MAELGHRSEGKDTFDDLLNDVNSLLEDGECTPSEILSERLDLDNSYDLDDFNEGDDENSDFEITGARLERVKYIFGSERDRNPPLTNRKVLLPLQKEPL